MLPRESTVASPSLLAGLLLLCLAGGCAGTGQNEPALELEPAPSPQREWTRAFQEKAVLLADEIHIEGPFDLIDHVAQGDEIARAFGHLERLAVFPQLHQLGQLDVQRHLPFAQRRDRRLHPLDIAAVIGAEHIN